MTAVNMPTEPTSHAGNSRRPIGSVPIEKNQMERPNITTPTTA